METLAEFIFFLSLLIRIKKRMKTETAISNLYYNNSTAFQCLATKTSPEYYLTFRLPFFWMLNYHWVHQRKI